MQQVPRPCALIANGFGYTRGDWEKVVGSMVALPQADRARPSLDYLATNFPEKNRPKSVIVPGKAQVSIQGMDGAVARLAAARSARDRRRRDLVDRQWANVLGRVDPKTGEMKEFPLKTPGPARTA